MYWNHALHFGSGFESGPKEKRRSGDVSPDRRRPCRLAPADRAARGHDRGNLRPVRDPDLYRRRHGNRHRARLCRQSAARRRARRGGAGGRLGGQSDAGAIDDGSAKLFRRQLSGGGARNAWPALAGAGGRRPQRSHRQLSGAGNGADDPDAPRRHRQHHGHRHRPNPEDHRAGNRRGARQYRLDAVRPERRRAELQRLRHVGRAWWRRTPRARIPATPAGSAL